MQSERREPDANENPYSRARLNSENTKLRAEITRLTEALRAAEEREKALREAGYALLQLIGPDNSRVYANDPQVIAFRQAITGAKP